MSRRHDASRGLAHLATPPTEADAVPSSRRGGGDSPFGKERGAAFLVLLIVRPKGYLSLR